MRLVPGIVGAAIVVTIITSAFWLSGFNFNERGPVAVSCFTFTVMGAVWGFCIAQMFFNAPSP